MPREHGSSAHSLGREILYGVAAVLLWVGLGVSLGWYYTFTYYGRSGWPMPTPDSCAGLVLYYFSVLNVRTELQAVHWLVVFPLAGMLWVLSLQLLAPRFGIPAPRVSQTLLRLSFANAPLIILVPWMTHVAGSTPEGFRWSRMMDVALRRGNVSPWPWLTPLYVALGCAALALQVCIYRRQFTARGKTAWYHFLTSAITLTIAASCIGGVGGMLLPRWFE